LGGELDAGGYVHAMGADFFDGGGDVGGGKAAGEPDGAVQIGLDEEGGAVEVDEGAGAAECSRD